MIFGGIGLIDGYFQGQFGWGVEEEPKWDTPPAFAESQPGIYEIADLIESANLPVELKDSADQVLLDATKGFEACEEAYQTSGIYWQYRDCNANQFRVSRWAIEDLEKGATLITTNPAGDITFA